MSASPRSRLGRAVALIGLAAVVALAGCSKGSATKDSSADGVTTIGYLTFSAAPDYTKSLFAGAGVACPTRDWKWSDETAAAQKLPDKGKGVYGDFQPVTFNEFYKAVNQAGGTFLSADGKPATFNSPQGVAAAKWLI